jgi:hypothetical protein
MTTFRGKLGVHTRLTEHQVLRYWIVPHNMMGQYQHRTQVGEKGGNQEETPEHEREQTTNCAVGLGKVPVVVTTFDMRPCSGLESGIPAR